jgi:hypothetical protein
MLLCTRFFVGREASAFISRTLQWKKSKGFSARFSIGWDASAFICRVSNGRYAALVLILLRVGKRLIVSASWYFKEKP